MFLYFLEMLNLQGDLFKNDPFERVHNLKKIDWATYSGAFGNAFPSTSSQGKPCCMWGACEVRIIKHIHIYIYIQIETYKHMYNVEYLNIKIYQNKMLYM